MYERRPTLAGVVRANVDRQGSSAVEEGFLGQVPCRQKKGKSNGRATRSLSRSVLILGRIDTGENVTFSVKPSKSVNRGKRGVGN